MLRNSVIKSWFFGAIALGAILVNHASADVLINVDLSVANQVTISATTGNSSATVSGSDGIGIYLENFYGGAGDPLTETLFGTADFTNAENPADGTPNLFRGGSGSDPGLNIWSWSSDATVTFTAGSLAFVGSATFTLDPNEYADMLNGNTFGDIYFPADSSDDIPGATVIGQYQVSSIPEPASLSLIGMGIGLIALRRRRK